MLESGASHEQELLSFGLQLRRYRIEAGLTQQELAERAGVSVRGLSDLERGTRRAPYMDTVERLAKALSLDATKRTSLLLARGRLKQLRAVAGVPPVQASNFVGRHVELHSVIERLRTAEQGNGSLVLIAGEPGIGKTRLVEEIATVARGHGDRVLWGRCWEGHGAPAFWPWVQIMRAFARSRPSETFVAEMGSAAPVIGQLLEGALPEISRLPPPPALEPSQARFRLFDAFSTFLKDASLRQPMVLILDDLHYADTPSLLLLQFLVREIRDACMLVIGSYRDVEVSRDHRLARTIGELAGEPHVRRVLLQGLSEQDVGRCIAQTAGQDLSVPLVTSIFEETEGNPFFVIEITRLLVAEGPVKRTIAETTWRPTIPQSVREVINRRLDRLSSTCNRLLTLAGVIGREFALGALEHASGLEGDRLLAVLGEAEKARVIAQTSSGMGRYRFTHALIRDTLYEQLTTGLRTQLHRRVGRALEEVYGTDIEPRLAELAHHFLQAAPGGDVEKAVAYAVRAAERAGFFLAFEEAVRSYDLAVRALELTPVAGERHRCELLLKLGDAQNRAGDRDEAKATFVRAADLARKAGTPEQFALAALGHGGIMLTGGRVDHTLVDLLQEALRILSVEDGPLRVRVLSRLAMELYFTDSLARRAALSKQAVDMARRIGDPASLATALFCRHLALWDPRNVEERLIVASEIVQLATDTADNELALQGHRWRMPDLLELGETTAAWEELHEHARLAHSLRQPFYVWDAVRWQAMRALLEGRFSEAEQLMQEANNLGQRVLSGTSRLYLVWHLFVLRSDQGRLEELQAAVEECVAQYPAIVAWRCWRALLYVELGRELEARRELEELACDEFASLPQDLMWLAAMSVLAQVCTALGDVARSKIVFKLLLPFANRNGVVGSAVVCYGAVSRYLGVLATTMGRWDEAGRHLQAALEANQRLGAVPLVAHTEHEFARMLLARDQPGDRGQALALATQALHSAEGLGMLRLVEEIRKLDLRNNASEHKVARRPSPGGLSAREVEVLRLVAAGKTNREIAGVLAITPNTVLRHVSNIFGKTHAANRAEAATYAAQNGLLLADTSVGP